MMRYTLVVAVALLAGGPLGAQTPAPDTGVIRHLLDEGRYTDALPLARHAVVADAGSAAAHALLGEALTGLNRPAEAVTEFSTATQMDAANADYLMGLGEAQLGLFAHGLAEWRRTHGDSPVLGMLTSAIPGSMAGGSFRYSPEGGPVLGETDKMSLATREDQEARDPRFDPGRSNMGTLQRPIAAMNAGEREKFQTPVRAALKSFDRALALNPGAVRALRGRAVSLFCLLDYASAGPAYQKAAETARTDGTLYQMAAVAYTRADRTDDAIRMWEAAINVQPAQIEAYRQLQDLYAASRKERWETRYYAAMERLLSGKANAALSDLRWVTEQHPEYEPGWRASGSACLALKDHRKAVEYLQKALSLNPADGLAEYELGAALALSGDTKAAQPHYMTAAKLRPDYAPVWFALGQQAEKGNDPDTAIAMYERALDYQPTWAEAHFSLGAILLEQRRGAEALPHLERYLALKPDAPDSKDVKQAIEQIKALK